MYLTPKIFSSGLGTGNAATALIKHGVPTTVVEIDPAVYNVSRRFFGLPDLGDDHVFLEDARMYVRKKKTQLEQGSKDPKFTYVIHDVFSGGGVPAHLFTSQFWEELKAIMHPEGVVAVVSMDHLCPCGCKKADDNSFSAEFRRVTGHGLLEGRATHFRETLWPMSRFP